MRKSILLFAAIALALTTATAGVAMANNGNVASYTDKENKSPPLERWLWGKSRGPFCNGFGPLISVSEEFKDNVINIAKSDPDVQNLLNSGYENMRVSPIIQGIVQANGDVTFKATAAIVTLNKDWSRAMVYVDLVAGKVTRVVTAGRNAIKKP